VVAATRTALGRAHALRAVRRFALLEVGSGKAALSHTAGWPCVEIAGPLPAQTDLGVQLRWTTQTGSRKQKTLTQ